MVKFLKPPVDDRPAKYFHWDCNNRDERHGMFHDDFGGCCFARSKKLFTSIEAATRAAQEHMSKCQLRHYRAGCTILSQPRKNSRRSRYVSEVKYGRR